jgi:hypothetical protein
MRLHSGRVYNSFVSPQSGAFEKILLEEFGRFLLNFIEQTACPRVEW